MTKQSAALAASVALAVLSVSAHADSLSDIFTTGHVDGELRLYNFNRTYESKNTPDASALSGSLQLNAQTGSFKGFSLGASLMSANSFGTQSNNIKKIDTTLMGPDNSISALGQAYLQYKNDWLLLRGGYQYLNTPWMGKDDSRVIPASYNALMVDITPAKGWDIIGIRSFEWRSRTSTDYFSDNLYYPTTYHGDVEYGNNGSLPITARSATGTWALGSTYVNGGLKAQAWYYNFIHFAHMGYAEGSYVFKNDSGFNPVLGMQYVNETTGSNNVLVSTHTKIVGIAGSEVKNNTWGADLGVVIPHGRFDVFYNRMSQENGAVGDGALISPYTTTYATDPLYTTSMLRGLVEQGHGHAWKAKASYNLFDDKLQLVAAYTKYFTYLRGDSHNLYFDIVYNLDGYLKGLSLRDRWERSGGGINNLNPGNESFTYNRVMLSYKF